MVLSSEMGGKLALVLDLSGALLFVTSRLGSLLDKLGIQHLFGVLRSVALVMEQVRLTH